MLNRLFLPTVSILLLYGFWISSEFKIVAAGVAVFFLGMANLEKGFKLYTGGFLENILKKTTNTLWKSISFGCITTSLFQSSSLTSVIVISFVSAGLIGLEAGVGIIFGANLGSTVGAWLVALFGLKINLSAYAMPLLVFGLLLNSRYQKSYKGVGYILVGVGFVFLGIHYMKEGFDAFQSTINLTEFKINGFYGVLMYTLVGIIATIVMQSTNALLVLVFSALAAGQLGYDNALAIAIGSNIGTTVTALLGAIGANEQGKRLAVAHLVFNLVIGAIAIILFNPLLGLVDNIASFLGLANDKYTIKLAIFHSLFNIIGIIVFLPFINLLVKKLNTLFSASFSKKPLNLANADEYLVERAIYLNQAVLTYPDTAMRAMTKECSRLYRNTLELICYGTYFSGEQLRATDNLSDLVDNWQHKDQQWSIKELYIKHIKGIYADIIHFGGALEGSLPKQQAQELFALKVACRNFVQAIKHVKHIYKNMGLYIESDNEQIRHQYNQLRLCLASTLKLIDLLGVKRNYDHIHERTAQLKFELQEQDRKTNSIINELIRSEQVDSYMASSLLNDISHVHDACTSLIDGAVIMLTRDKEEFREQDLGGSTIY
ncbi:MAG: Na/Pi symporter [Candidatus Endonucleobacter bathymodioli]|uniref:Na/Pi symporter n=1 Tax=Candidatus Endonucleibacter bathymodioli TaxID=539814 RepID=A0AA90NMX2_9GAMM|nr:Na/Pi symporter [Candidatus Endonucleobacter bathymodioli]